jgi:transposase
VEDCRHVAARLLADLLAAGEQVVLVPPRRMATARQTSRVPGKSDAIDALAVARAALQEPNLPRARLDGPARELKLLVGHREDLVAECTRIENRLRWHLHDLDPERAAMLPTRHLEQRRVLEELEARKASALRNSEQNLEKAAQLDARAAELEAQAGRADPDSARRFRAEAAQLREKATENRKNAEALKISATRTRA